MSTMDVTLETRTASWRDAIAAHYETQQVRLTWQLRGDDDPEEYL
ncbi:hypothetical protein [Georgenia wutianyii]|nr:hypothetical protein [Georgenia wutianyii]